MDEWWTVEHLVVHLSNDPNNDVFEFFLQVKFEMDFVSRHEFESEGNVLCDLSFQKISSKKIKVESSSPSSSPHQLDVSSESDSVQKVPSLGDVYDACLLKYTFSAAFYYIIDY